MFNESEEAQVLAALAEKIGKPCNIETLEMLAARRAVIFLAWKLVYNCPTLKVILKQ